MQKGGRGVCLNMASFAVNRVHIFHFQEKYFAERRSEGGSEYQLARTKKGVYTERELVRWPPDL